MVLKKEDREVLFSTPITSLQMQRYLSSHNGKSTIKEMREVWSDLSKGIFLSTLISLESRGILNLDEQDVNLVKEVSKRGCILDSVWRAARVRKVFTTDDILNDLPHYSYLQVSHALRSLEKSNGIRKIGEKKAKNTLVNIYQVFKDVPLRPIKKKKRKTSKADLVWSVCQSFNGNEFTSRDIQSKLDYQISRRYMRQLFEQWEFERILECRRDNTYYYRIIGSQRTSVIKNNKSWIKNVMGETNE